MSETTITIFDDPEYCDEGYHAKKYKKCDLLSMGGCMGFPDLEKWGPTTRRLGFDHELGRYIKCEECKTALKESNGNT